MSCKKNMKRPFFATGYLIEDYEPLMKYWEFLRKEGREDILEKAFLDNEDYEILKKIAREKVGRSLAEIFDELIGRFLERIDAETALKAFREAGYKTIGLEEAKRSMARILAGWLLEAGENLKIIAFSSGRQTRRVG
ncbi:MAG: hypothetical protein F7C32_01390 [Desulfurococcales archaeon]|nr:hypothetical protein [Desulfurococcales archaeon]